MPISYILRAVAIGMNRTVQCILLVIDDIYWSTTPSKVESHKLNIQMKVHAVESQLAVKVPARIPSYFFIDPHELPGVSCKAATHSYSQKHDRHQLYPVDKYSQQ